jgi:hypothetical protein
MKRSLAPILLMALAGGVSAQTPLPAWVRADSGARTVTLDLAASRPPGGSGATINGALGG